MDFSTAVTGVSWIPAMPSETEALEFRFNYDDGESEDGMRSLFEVFIIDPELSVILLQELIIARTGEAAKLRAIASYFSTGSSREVEDMDFVIDRRGHGREIRPRKDGT